MRRFAFLDNPGAVGTDESVLALAHRGGTGRHPENTLEAFADAIAQGYRYIETDVHASSDGTLFAFHDPDLGRVTGVEAAIADLTADEIDKIRFGVRNYRVPRFDDLLTTWPDVRINIDPKADAAVQPLERTLAPRDDIERFCVGSFSDRRLRYLRREIGPDLCTSMGPIDLIRLFVASKGIPVGSFDAPCAQVPLEYKKSFVSLGFDTADFIDEAHNRGIDVHFWTIDDRPTMNRLIDLGVDGIMTDRPSVLRSVLTDRKLWIP